MSLKLRKIIFILLLALLTLGGLQTCGGGTGSGNPASPTPPVPVFGDFVLGVATSNGAATASNSKQNMNSLRSNSVSFQNAAILLEETRNVISDIAFKPTNEGSAELDFPGMYVVELITGGSVVNKVFPSFDPKQIAFTSYNEFEMKFDKINAGNIPPGLLQDPLVNQYLVDQSIVIEGSFLESAANDINKDGKISYIPFRLISNKDVNIRVTSPNSFTVSSNKINYFFIAFQVNNWFNNTLALFQVVTSRELTNGVLIITDKSNKENIRAILNQFENNLDASCKSAPSNNGEFEESDVDGESSSGTF